MKVVFKQDGGIGVIELHGRLDAYNAPELKAVYDQAAEKVTNFVIDMAECDFIDSTGLGTIVPASNQLHRVVETSVSPACKTNHAWFLISPEHIRYLISSTIWMLPCRALEIRIKPEKRMTEQEP